MTKFMNSRDFNQDISAAKRATEDGPVVITDRGTPAYVLLKHEDYLALVGGGHTILGMLDQADAPDFDFEPPKLDRVTTDHDEM